MFPQLPRALILSAASALMLSLVALEAQAYPGRHGLGQGLLGTSYVQPTTILMEPTSYFVPTVYSTASYVVPTSYVSRTAFVPTSYVSRTAFVPTSYVSRTAYIRPATLYSPTRYVVRSPLVTTSRVVESAYYLPTTTTLDLPIVATSSSLDCYDSAPVVYDDGYSSSEVIRSDEPIYQSDTPSEGSPSRAVPSAGPGANGEPSLSPDVLQSSPTQPTTRQTDSPPAAGSAGSRPPADPEFTNPPLLDPTEINPPLPTPAEEMDSPIAPPDPTATSDTERRDVFRPAFTRPISQARSWLEGRVVSAVTGEVEAGVEVTLYDRSGRFARTATTDDTGRFTVVLPEGDWAVTAPRPGADEGEETVDRFITVSGGVITDDEDREVTLLTINR